MHSVVCTLARVKIATSNQKEIFSPKRQNTERKMNFAMKTMETPGRSRNANQRKHEKEGIR
jgi:hypothetical protein